MQQLADVDPGFVRGQGCANAGGEPQAPVDPLQRHRQVAKQGFDACVRFALIAVEHAHQQATAHGCQRGLRAEGAADSMPEQLQQLPEHVVPLRISQSRHLIDLDGQQCAWAQALAG